MASPETCALWLSEELAAGPPEAYIDGLEFCHLHAAPEGSLHLTLPDIFRHEMIRRGWAEPHPLARAGIVPNSLVMLYAPRNESELEVAIQSVEVSYRFAQGRF